MMRAVHSCGCGGRRRGWRLCATWGRTWSQRRRRRRWSSCCRIRAIGPRCGGASLLVLARRWATEMRRSAR
eukprot:2105166-Prymnesium_polylepis.1